MATWTERALSILVFGTLVACVVFVINDDSSSASTTAEQYDAPTQMDAQDHYQETTTELTAHKYKYTRFSYDAGASGCNGHSVDDQFLFAGTDVLNTCVAYPAGVPSGLVQRLQCDAKGNVIWQQWGHLADGATITDCEQNKTPKQSQTFLYAHDNDKCMQEVQVATEPNGREGTAYTYYKTKWTCPPVTTGLEAPKRFTCPDYASIATPAVSPARFSLEAFTGLWYMMATNEPTMPSFCTCPTETWFLDSNAAVKQYHYQLNSTCGFKLDLTMKGDAKDPEHPGKLDENAEVYNHSVAPYLPNYIFDIQTLSDGTELGFTYACISTELQLFSFNVFSRRPTVSRDELETLIARQNERTGGIFKVDGIRYADATACKWN